MRLLFLMAVPFIATVVSLGAFAAGDVRRGLAFWLAWLVPGLGHLVIGHVRKAVFFFCVVAGLYVFGLYICGWRPVDFDDNPFYYVGRVGSGATLLFGWLLGVEKSFPRVDLPKSWYDPGLLYVCVAGLLNLVIMLSVFEMTAKPVAAPAAVKGPEVKE